MGDGVAQLLGEGFADLFAGTDVRELSDDAIIDRANLKKTSLFDLAVKSGISDPLGFVECFIHYDREVRKNET